MSAVYPTSLVTFTTKTNHVDVYDASHVNRIQEEVVALQTYIGTNPHGSKNTLTDRLGVMIATDGTLAHSAGFPAASAEGQAFWRTDQQTLYIFGNSAWNSQGQSLSNVLFTYCLSGAVSGSAAGITASTSATPVPVANKYMWAPTAANVYQTAVIGEVKKLSGMSSIRVDGSIWCASQGTILRASIGSVVGSVKTTAIVPTWNTVTLDISGLANGTVYSFVAEVFASNESTAGYMNSLIGIAS
jgi:hypothetical protein